MPLGRDVQIAVVHGRGILDYSAHAILVGGEGVAEFPIGVALEIKACLRWELDKC